MKKKKHFLLSLVMIGLLLTCKPMDDMFELSPDDGLTYELNERGKAFMEAFQACSNWEQEWEFLTKVGTPLPNQAVFFEVPSPADDFFVLPVAQNNHIVHLRLVYLTNPENFVLRAETDTLSIRQDPIGQMRTSPEKFDKWQENGYTIASGLLPTEEAESTESSTHILDTSFHTYSFELQINMRGEDRDRPHHEWVIEHLLLPRAIFEMGPQFSSPLPGGPSSYHLWDLHRGEVSSSWRSIGVTVQMHHFSWLRLVMEVPVHIGWLGDFFAHNFFGYFVDYLNRSPQVEWAIVRNSALVDISIAPPWHTGIIPLPPVGGGGGTGGGGNNSSAPPGTIAASIFDGNLTLSEWNTVERMLEKMKKDCMGQALLNSVAAHTRNRLLNISFVDGDISWFRYRYHSIKLGRNIVGNMGLFHELFHFDQLATHRRSYDAIPNSRYANSMNREIEAWVAEYIFMTRNADHYWHDSELGRLENSSIGRSVRNFAEINIDQQGRIMYWGGLYDNINRITAALRAKDSYRNFPQHRINGSLTQQSPQDMFRNIARLSADC